MGQLVSTLRSVLEEADAYLAGRRPGRARAQYEKLLEQAQDRADRPMAVIARAMLARLAISRRQLEEARHLLDEAKALADASHLESQGRLRGSEVRWRIAMPGEPVAEPLRAYFDWSDDHRRWEEAVDACSLLAEQAEAAFDAIQWLERGLEIARLHGVERPVGTLLTHLAALQEKEGAHKDALRAHEAALAWQERHGTPRDRVAACWAVGACAVILEDWPLAQQRLEQALSLAAEQPEAQNLLPVVLADLATTYEASGDVVEAQRTLTRALAAAREQDLATWWPERWAAMSRHADALAARL